MYNSAESIKSKLIQKLLINSFLESILLVELYYGSFYQQASNQSNFETPKAFLTVLRAFCPSLTVVEFRVFVGSVH